MNQVKHLRRISSMFGLLDHLATLLSAVLATLTYFGVVPHRKSEVPLAEGKTGAAASMTYPERNRRVLFLLVLTWVLMLITWIWSGVNTYKNSQAPRFDKNATFERITSRIFRNEVVLIDGKDYSDCTFINVTFEYDGTTNIRFGHNTIIGSPLILAKSPAASSALALAKGLGLIDGSVPIYGPDWKPLPSVQPPTRK